MILYGDYHTHTRYSGKKIHVKHGKSTILENALCAKQKGLKEIGITEHGFNHIAYGIKRKYLKDMREEIEIVKEKTGINILLGIEANFISSDGDIDVREEDLKYLDYLVVGFHKFVKAKNIKEFFKFILPNVLGFHRKKDIKRNTLAVLKAMDKYPIDIISHPGVNMPVDFNEIVPQANKTSTILELNGKRIAYTQKDVEILKKHNAKLIINSDAHIATNVGECNKGVNFAIMYDINRESIVNLSTRPNFKRLQK